MFREVSTLTRPSLAMALLCALGLHAWLWQWLHPSAPSLRSSGAHSALQARAITTMPALPAALAPPLPAPEAVVRRARPAADATQELPATPAPPTEALPPTPATALAQPVRGSGSLRYRLTQGQAQGEALLSWDVGDSAYQVRLERELEGRPLPVWRSEGGIDPQQGLSPQRFAVQRGGRDRQAINFRREQGLISFSASSELQTLPDGVQDRLSWWLQLPALLAAQPQRLIVGQDVLLPVAAMRGHAVDWVFRVEGQDADGHWHLSRTAIGPYDAQLDIWLDPRHQYLPVRVRHRLGDEERWDMQLLPSDER